MTLSPQTREQIADLRSQVRDGHAADALDELVALAGRCPDVEVLELLGRCYLALGRTQEAIMPLAAAVGLTDHAEPAALLASTLLKVGRHREALLAAQRVLHRDPRNKDALRIMQQLPRE